MIFTQCTNSANTTVFVQFSTKHQGFKIVSSRSIQPSCSVAIGAQFEINRKFVSDIPQLRRLELALRCWLFATLHSTALQWLPLAGQPALSFLSSDREKDGKNLINTYHRSAVRDGVCIGTVMLELHFMSRLHERPRVWLVWQQRKLYVWRITRSFFWFLLVRVER